MYQETIDDIYEIIQSLGDDALKIPANIIRFFKDNASKPFVKRLKLENGLENQNFSVETCAVIKFISIYLKDKH